MNTELQNYLDYQKKIDRIEGLTNADFDTRYMLEKFIPALWADGYEAEDIIDYMAVKVHSTITKLSDEGELTTTKNT